MRWLIYSNRLLLTALAVLSINAYSATNISQQSMIYQDAEVQPLPLESIKTQLLGTANTLEKIDLQVDDKLTLTGIKMLNPDAQANVVLYSGNGATIAKVAGYLRSYAQLPINMMWFDYRGTGASQKSADVNMPQLQQDALVIFDNAKSQLPEQLPMVVNGISMGTLIAPYVAQHRQVDGIVLDSAIENVEKLLMSITQQTDPAALNIPEVMKTLDNKPVLASLHQPLLLLEGEQDQITPPEIAQTLYKASAAAQKHLEIIPKIGHARPMTTPQGVMQYAQFIALLK